MRKLIEKITTFFKEYWNIYTPFIISTIISWFTNWNANQLQVTNQYFGNIISLCCLLTMLKFLFFPNKDKKGIEKIVTSQKSVKNMEITSDIEKTLEETIDLVKTSVKGGKSFMNKIKQFFKWVWKYKEQLIGLTGTLIYAIFVVYVYVNDKFGWVFEIIPNTDFWNYAVRISFGILSAIFVFYVVRNQVKWCGLGSLEKAQEYLDSLAEKFTSESTLSDKAKKKISEALKTMNKSLKEAKTLLDKYKSLYNKAVDEVNVFQELISNQLEYDEAGYQRAVANVSEIGKEIEVTQATIDSLSLKIEHYNDVLNSKK